MINLKKYALSVKHELFVDNPNDLFEFHSLKKTIFKTSIPSLLSLPSLVVSTPSNLDITSLSPNNINNTPNNRTKNALCEIKVGDDFILLNLLTKKDTFFVTSKVDSFFYRINSNDLIQLGTVTLKVVSFKTEITQKALSNSISTINEQLALRPMPTNKEHNNKLNPTCRICLCNEIKQEDPLLSACGCKGTLEYIHLSCLRKYIKLKREKNKDITYKSSGPKVYCFKPVKCDLCGKAFPSKTTLKNGSVIRIEEIAKPHGNFLLIEIENSYENNGKDLKGTLFLLDFNTTSYICIGRGNDDDLILSDTTVSRRHCMILGKPEGYFLVDYNSTYGTLVNSPRIVPLFPSLPLWLKIGHSCYKFKLKAKFIFSDLFFCSRVCKKRKKEKIRKGYKNIQDYNDFFYVFGKNEQSYKPYEPNIIERSISISFPNNCSSLPLCSVRRKQLIIMPQQRKEFKLVHSDKDLVTSNRNCSSIVNFALKSPNGIRTYTTMSDNHT